MQRTSRPARLATSSRDMPRRSRSARSDSTIDRSSFKSAHEAGPAGSDRSRLATSLFSASACSRICRNLTTSSAVSRRPREMPSVTNHLRLHKRSRDKSYPHRPPNTQQRRIARRLRSRIALDCPRIGSLQSDPHFQPRLQHPPWKVHVPRCAEHFHPDRRPNPTAELEARTILFAVVSD